MKCTLIAACVLVLASVAFARYMKTPPGMKVAKNFRPAMPAEAKRVWDYDYTKCDFEWPWAVMQFYQFVGRCEYATMFFREMSMPFPSEGLLAAGCPFALNMSRVIMSATEVHRDELETLFEGIFHIMQCGNLMAQNETYFFWAEYYGLGYDDSFFMSMRPLTDMCAYVFGGVREEIDWFRDELYRIMQTVDVPTWGGYMGTRSTDQLEQKLEALFNKEKPRRYGYPYKA